jgi:multiple sugar transport system ATP-binding protein
MARVSFDHLSKEFENGYVAVNDFSLEIQDGELMVLVGPSGCGKSTVLRMLAGLEDITAGSVIIDGVVVNEMPPQDRDIAMVFQSYALYPHLTVRENIEFGLKIHHLAPDEIASRVDSAAELLGLTEFLDRKPKQLSGGQRQRAAMGRALVREPKVFLLDEPLSNLDAKLRVHMRSEIGLLQQRLGVTMLYVTHDQVEAMTMGDRVAVMKNGALLQVGPPKQIYNEPVNAFVAGFIGSPAMNTTQAVLSQGEGALSLKFGSTALKLEPVVLQKHPKLAAVIVNGGAVHIGIRPEDLEDASLVAADPNHQIVAKVDIVEELGSQTMVHFQVDSPAVPTEDLKDVNRGSGKSTPFIGAFSPRSNVKNGDTVRIAVDTTRIHFFDPTAGLSL